MRRYLPILIVLLALAARLIPGPRTIDDAYITFRYARHIVAGEGMVYNPGERVLGTTTPLYAGLMAALGLIAGGESAPFPVLAMSANALFDALTCFLLLRLGERLGAPRAGVGAALVWAILPFSVTFAIGGLETSLYVALLTGAAYAHLTGKHVPAALLAALSLLTRPDALILLALLALDRLLTAGLLHRSAGRQASAPITGAEVAAALLLPLAWFGFAWLYFGHPIPNSIAAKSAAYLLPPEQALVRLTQHYATPFMDHLTFGIPGIMVGFGLYPFLFLVGARAAWQANRRAWPWLAFPWLYFAVFAAANPLIFRWYLTPPLPAYVLGILIGLDRVATALAVRLEGGRWRGALQVCLVVVLPFFLSGRDWQVRPDHGLSRPAPEMAWYALELVYRQAAEALAGELTTSPVRPTLAAGDVGVLGYFTSARILDTVGLNSPEALPYYPLPAHMHANAYAVAPDLILDHLPDYVVLLEVYGRQGLFKDPRFGAAYELRLKIPTDIYASEGMLIFERKARP